MKRRAVALTEGRLACYYPKALPDEATGAMWGAQAGTPQADLAGEPLKTLYLHDAETTTIKRRY